MHKTKNNGKTKCVGKWISNEVKINANLDPSLSAILFNIINYKRFIVTLFNAQHWLVFTIRLKLAAIIIMMNQVLESNF